MTWVCEGPYRRGSGFGEDVFECGALPGLSQSAPDNLPAVDLITHELGGHRSPQIKFLLPGGAGTLACGTEDLVDQKHQHHKMGEDTGKILLAMSKVMCEREAAAAGRLHSLKGFVVHCPPAPAGPHHRHD